MVGYCPPSRNQPYAASASVPHASMENCFQMMLYTVNVHNSHIFSSLLQPQDEAIVWTKIIEDKKLRSKTKTKSKQDSMGLIRKTEENACQKVKI